MRLLAVAAAAIHLGGACSVIIPPPNGSDENGGDDDGAPIYNNTTDPTNKGATYIGAEACRSCHVDIGADHRLHGHANGLTATQGLSPEFLGSGSRAVVPDPPAGYEWTDVAYVFAGYLRAAYFIDTNGYFITSGSDGSDALWRLAYPPNGSTPAFNPYFEDASALGFSCLKCHTTGWAPQDPSERAFQDNRPGFAGTWFEAGVTCEKCHGPGSNHLPHPDAREMYVDSRASFCAQCHTHGDDANVIAAHDGFIFNNAQYPELRSSGGHSDFNCTFCHDPHVSPNYDNGRAIRNDCTDCHTTQTMALHNGLVYHRGDYTEGLTCRSCHMPYAGRAGSAASVEVVGESGRMGDTRTHIFRINPQAVSYTEMFTPDLSAVAKDANGRAAVSLDFVCLRCHNGIGNASRLDSAIVLSDVATGMHDKMLSKITAIQDRSGAVFDQRDVGRSAGFSDD